MKHAFSRRAALAGLVSALAMVAHAAGPSRLRLRSGHPPPGPGPVNTMLPSIGGDAGQGGTLVFTPGVWTDATSYRYRVLQGDALAPTATVLLDWTVDPSTLVMGISDGDFLWLQEEATGPDGVTIATSAFGFGPMVALAPADASVIGAGGLATASNTAAVTYTFSMDIADVPSRKFELALHFQIGLASGTAPAVEPAWSSATVGGIPLTKIKEFSGNDGLRWYKTEIWELTGNTVPVGTGIVVSGTRGSSGTDSCRSIMSAVAVGNTGVAALAAADVTQQVNASDLASYSFSVTTSLAKRLVLVFVNGQWVTFTGPTASLTPGSGWTKNIDAWPGARSGAGLAWGAAMSKAVASASTFNADYTAVDSGNGAAAQRYGIVTVLQLSGDNS